MKAIFTITLIFCLTTSYGQFTSNDIKIEINGLSEEYEQKFRTAAKQIPELLNKLDITSKIKPLTLEVTYEDSEVNYIRFIANFNPDSVFSEWKYKQHQRSMQTYGDGGVSVFLIHELFSVLTEFKVTAAREGYSVDTEIIGFDNVVRLVNKKKDWVQFYSYNDMNSYGFFETNFYNQVHFKISNIDYELESNNYRALSQMKFFWAGKTTGLDGKPTPSYHFLKFFNLLDK